MLSACTTISGSPTPTKQDAEPSESGSMFPPVTFIPCEEIDDATVQQLGLDPASRTAENHLTEVELFTCSFTSYGLWVSFISQNTPWEEMPGVLTGPQHPTTVNGRESIYAIDPIGENSCAVVMRTDYGEVIVDIFLRGRPDLDPNRSACDGIMQIAETIEPLIDQPS